jgi:phenylalanyl-tRNA synthetase beta chain
MVRLINPLSQDQAVMTQTLLLGMVKAMSWNVNRKNTDLSVLRRSVRPLRDGEKKYEERPCVSIGLTGHVSNDWVSEKRAHTFYDLKGILWTLLERLGIKGCEIVPSAEAQFCPGGSLMWKGRKIGAAGSVDKKILKAFDINTDVFCCELSLDAILEDICLDKAFTPIPRFPSVVRDISILAEENTRGSITSCRTDTGKNWSWLCI